MENSFYSQIFEDDSPAQEVRPRGMRLVSLIAFKGFVGYLIGTLVIYLSPVPMAYANPLGGNVSAGNASIQTSGKTETITQKTPNAVIDWSSFNISGDETTKFVQPNASSLTVNRVDSQDPSKILGTLSANGNIVLINPNGVFFGKGSKVDVNGIIATTSNVSNDNVMGGGKLRFTPGGNPNATVENQGTITAKDAGLVGLVAPNVSNSGVITANLGKVQLSSGDSFTLDLYGDKLMEIGVSSAVSQQIVKNSGSLEADGGTVKITAAAGRQLVNSLIEVEGEIKTPTVKQHNGKIIIDAAGSNAVKGNVAANKGLTPGASAVQVSGTLDASGKNAGETGGKISVLADNVAIQQGAMLDASGSAGGGYVNIGGDFHGAGTTPTALNTTVANGATINANALDSGNGGNVAVWSDQLTTFAGQILATGGKNSGNGGFVETSGHQLKAMGTVDAGATHGQAGTWLLDPNNIVISQNSCTGTSCSSANTISTSLNTTNVTVTTTDGSITLSGNIAESTRASGTLTLNAGTDIIISASNSITASGSSVLNVVLDAGTAGVGGAIVMNSGSSITSNGGAITLGGQGNAAANPAVGDLTYTTGINLTSATLNAGGGNISLRGNGYSGGGGTGISVDSGSSITTTGAGTITLIGIGGTGNTGSTGGAGISIAGSISSGTGTITITGTGGNGGAGTNGADASGADGQNAVDVGHGNGCDGSGDGCDGTNGGIGGNGGPGGNGGTGVIITGSVSSTGAGNIVITGTGGAGGPGGNGGDANGGNGGNGADDEEWQDSQGFGTQCGYDGGTCNGGNGGPGGTGGNGGPGGNGGNGLTISGTISSSGAGAITITATAGVVGTGGTGGTALAGAAGFGGYTDGGCRNNGSTCQDGYPGANGTNGSNGATGVAGSKIVLGGNLTVSSVGGTITFASVVDGTNAGTQNLTVNSGAGGSTVFNSTIGSAVSLHNLSITGDSLTLGGNIYGTGTLTIAPNTAGTALNINDGTSSGLYLTNTEQGYIQSGWSGITFGSTSDTATMKVGANTWNAPLTLLNGSGNIEFSGAQSMGAHAITANSVSGNIQLDSGATITSTASNYAITLAASGGNFVNNTGSGTPLNASSGSWRVWSTASGSDTNGQGSSGLVAATVVNSTSYPTTTGQSGKTWFYSSAGSTPENITLTATGQTITYGTNPNTAPTYNTTYTCAGAGCVDVASFSGGTITISGTKNSTSTYYTANTGHTITLSGVTPTWDSGYTTGTITYVTGTLTVNPASLTITGVTANNKQYDTTQTATLNTGGAALSGKVAGDTVNLGTGSATGTFASANVANGIAVNTAGFTISGADSANYNLTQPTTTANITAAPLTITANAGQNVVYGSNIGALTYTYSGLLGSDSTTFSGALTTAHGGAGTQASHANGLDVGNYAITQGSLAANNSNYSIVTYNSANLAVTPLAITVASGVSGTNKQYDTTTSDSLTFSAPTLNGVVGADAVSVNQATGTGTFANANVGNNKVVTVTGLGLSGAQSSDYTLTQPLGLTANITAAPLTITANAGQNVVYGSNIGALTYSEVGLLGSDTLAGALTTAHGGAGTQASHANGLDVGNYAILQGTLNNSNYTITYNSANLAVTPLAITVASGVTANNKPADGTTTDSLSFNTPTLAGVIGADTVSVDQASAYSANFSDPNVGNNKVVTVTGLGLTGSQSSDYTLTQPALTANITGVSTGGGPAHNPYASAPIQPAPAPTPGSAPIPTPIHPVAPATVAGNTIPATVANLPAYLPKTYIVDVQYDDDGAAVPVFSQGAINQGKRSTDIVPDVTSLGKATNQNVINSSGSFFSDKPVSLYFDNDNLYVGVNAFGPEDDDDNNLAKLDNDKKARRIERNERLRFTRLLRVRTVGNKLLADAELN